jgi:hypothetical protein
MIFFLFFLHQHIKIIEKNLKSIDLMYFLGKNSLKSIFKNELNCKNKHTLAIITQLS